LLQVLPPGPKALQSREYRQMRCGNGSQLKIEELRDLGIEERRKAQGTRLKERRQAFCQLLKPFKSFKSLKLFKP
jgi:hypothetical protein